MLKTIFSFLFFFLLIGFNSAQNYEKLTDDEKALIESNPGQLIRVIQTDVPEEQEILTRFSKSINPKDKFTKILAGRMLEAVIDPNNKGVGIAAPQVGVNRRMVLVQRFDKEDKPFEVFINPEILWQSELMQKGPEGDLSFEERGEVMRHYAVQIRYYNMEGEEITEILEGFTAVIFQHERDHLDGILLTDRIAEQKDKSYQYAAGSAGLYFETD